MNNGKQQSQHFGCSRRMQKCMRWTLLQAITQSECVFFFVSRYACFCCFCVGESNDSRDNVSVGFTEKILKRGSIITCLGVCVFVNPGSNPGTEGNIAKARRRSNEFSNIESAHSVGQKPKTQKNYSPNR